MDSRRALLRALAAGAVGLAGCSSDSPGRETPTDTMTTATRTTDRAETTDRTEATTDGPAEQCETGWTPDPDWRFERNRLRAPLATENRVLMSDAETVYALSPTDGSLEWERSIEATTQGVADGATIVRSSDRLTGLELTDGSTRWTADAPAEHAAWRSSMQVYDGTAYVGAVQRNSPERDVEEAFGRVYAIDAATGDRSLVADLQTADGNVVEPVSVLADDTGIYATLEQGGVFGLAHDGRVRWRRYGEDWDYEPLRTGSLVVQPWSRGVVALDVDSGETVWSDDRIDGPVAAMDGVLYGTSGGSPQTYAAFVALDAATGESRWESLLDGCGGTIAAGGGVVLTAVFCRPSRVELRDAASGCRLAALEDSSGGDAGLTVRDGTLFAALHGHDTDRLVAVPLP